MSGAAVLCSGKWGLMEPFPSVKIEAEHKGRSSDMEHIKKNFGFGFMRLPMKDGGIDLAQTSEMVDVFLDAGFNYFDTAHGYLGGKSETALKACLHQPLLHGRLSQAHFHSGSVCHHEHQAALP